MRRTALLLVAMLAVVIAIDGIAWAQDTRLGGSADAIRNQVNAGRVGVLSGGVSGTDVRIIADLAAVLDDRPDMRILPIVGQGSVQNITDILYLRGIDIGIVQADALAYVRDERIHPSIEARVRYIAKLHNEEFHLLARRDIESIEDLAGKSVNVGHEGSGTNITATAVFDALGIAVEPRSFDPTLALAKLKSGEIAAMATVAGKPASMFSTLEADNGLHLLPVPLTPELLDVYLPGRLEAGDYPRLMLDGASVDTIAVGAIMVVYNWPATHPRYRNLATFVDAFFESFDRFQIPSRHGKWREVNLAAEVPGWERFAPAEQWLGANVR